MLTLRNLLLALLTLLASSALAARKVYVPFSPITASWINSGVGWVNTICSITNPSAVDQTLTIEYLDAMIGGRMVSGALAVTSPAARDALASGSPQKMIYRPAAMKTAVSAVLLKQNETYSVSWGDTGSANTTYTGTYPTMLQITVAETSGFLVGACHFDWRISSDGHEAVHIPINSSRPF